ncbi:hypothetical protein R1sor_003588 [Riccia sorocarpa]|uniref:Uncharacterized protein n=1 Tax=Riccia sorocarpa TaxID=122646 RepID=A0ABD3H3Q3_9MARC
MIGQYRNDGSADWVRDGNLRPVEKNRGRNPGGYYNHVSNFRCLRGGNQIQTTTAEEEMSFWPRLRKRSSRARRKASRPNPYSGIGLDKLAQAHSEFDAQRARFAAEKGVPVSAVRFASGSARGWILLPRSAISPSPEEAHYDPSSSGPPSNASSASSSPERSGSRTPASSSTNPPLTTPHQQKLTPLTESVSNGRLEPRIADSNNSESSTERATTEGKDTGAPAPFLSTVSETPVADSSRTTFTEARGLTTLTKDWAWNSKLSQTATVVLVSLGVFFSTTFLSSGVLSVILSFWNALRASSVRALTLVATYLLSAVRKPPFLLLKQSSTTILNVVSTTSPSNSQEDQDEMKVTAASPLSVIPPLKEPDVADSPRSSFAFPVLSRDSSVSTPIFRIQQRGDDPFQAQGGNVITITDAVVPKLKPIITSVRVVAVSSQPGSPAAAFEVGSKGCHKLKSKIFKCSSSKKITPAATNSNLSVDEGDSMEVESPLTQSPSAAEDSPSRSKCRKKLSFKSRRSKSLLQPTEVENHPTGKFTPTEIELEDPNPPPEGSSSPEVLISRNPNNDDIAVLNGGNNKLKGSKSCELKLAFKNLKKKKHRSHELYPTSEFQPLALEAAAVKDLEELAFPFNHESDSSPSGSGASGSSTPVNQPGSGPRSEKRKSGLAKLLSGDSCKSREGNASPPPPPSNTTTTTTTSWFSKSTASPISRVEKSTFMDYRPELRQVRTVVGRAPSPAPGRGEPIRNLVLDSDISGTFLVLAVLALLLIGKVPAILGTACLCLVLSHVQKFLSHNMTPLQRERLAASRGGSASPEFSRIRGSSAGSGDVQSSDYRKKVLIEGFLQRGKGRMMA